MLNPIFEIAIDPYPQEVECTFWIVSEETEQLSNDLSEVLRLFSLGANSGMFFGSTYSPEQSSVTNVFFPKNGSKKSNMWRCLGRKIELGAYKVLLNMLRTVQGNQFSQIGISLRSPKSAVSRISLQDLLNVRFIDRISRLPFQLIDNLSEPPHKISVVRLEFQEVLDDNAAEHIFDIVRVWEDIVKRGGFVENFEKGEKGPWISASDLYLVAPSVLEYVVYGFEGPRAAFNLIVNLAMKLHQTLSAVCSLEIE